MWRPTPKIQWVSSKRAWVQKKRYRIMGRNIVLETYRVSGCLRMSKSKSVAFIIINLQRAKQKCPLAEQRQDEASRPMYRAVLLDQLQKPAHAQKLRFAQATRFVRTTAPVNQWAEASLDQLTPLAPLNLQAAARG